MAIDWILSLNPHWFSTIFGLLFIAGEGLSAMAFLICLLVILSDRPPLAGCAHAPPSARPGQAAAGLRHGVGVFFVLAVPDHLVGQPAGGDSLVHRTASRGGWQYIGLALVLLHFALPFALLLSRDLKRNFKLLRAVAVLVIVMRFVDLYWLVAPDFRKGALWRELDGFPGARRTGRNLAGGVPVAIGTSAR